MKLTSNSTEDCKRFYDAAYQPGHWSGYDGGEDNMASRVNVLYDNTQQWLISTGLALNQNASILEIGCGMAYLSSIHPGWYGAEYSASAVERVRQIEGNQVRIYEEDAQKLSFSDESFDGVFTWAALEHVPDPHRAFCEIDRVLRGGGYALVAPAWNCRSWTVAKLKDQPYSELNLIDAFRKYSIPLRENAFYRAVRSLPGRIMREIYMFAGKPINLDYKKLSPRWDLIEKYGHTSDDDAVAEIDSHAGIIFFVSRGYDIISHPSLSKRFISRHEPIVVRKPFDKCTAISVT